MNFEVGKIYTQYDGNGDKIWQIFKVLAKGKYELVFARLYHCHPDLFVPEVTSIYFDFWKAERFKETSALEQALFME